MSKEIKYCPVEHRTISEEYCDEIHCEMCPEGTCLGYEEETNKGTKEKFTDHLCLVQLCLGNEQ